MSQGNDTSKIIVNGSLGQSIGNLLDALSMQGPSRQRAEHTLKKFIGPSGQMEIEFDLNHGSAIVRPHSDSTYNLGDWG